MNPQTGQADYSAQWAEYYRSMGMVKEAEAIEAARVSQSQNLWLIQCFLQTFYLDRVKNSMS